MRFKDVLLVEKYLVSAFDDIWGKLPIRETFTKMIIDEKLYIHSIEVCKLATQMAITRECSETAIHKICIAGLLHDIGKTRISKDILYKKEPLSVDEFSIIKKHPTAGYAILKNAYKDEEICQMVLKHHEKITGKGYPYGTSEKTVQEEIITVADSGLSGTKVAVYHAKCSEPDFKYGTGNAAQLVSVKPEELKKMIHDGKVTDGFTMTALMMYLAKKTN